MKKRLLLALLSLVASSPAFCSLSTNNLGYYFDFNSQSAPGKCIYGSSNTPITSPSPISYNAGALTWHASGGVDDSGYIQTRSGGSTAADESLKVSSSTGLPAITCTNFAVSFNIRNYKRGAALFIINGATVNNSWGIWGVDGGTASWKDENGNATSTAPPLNTTNQWQSVVFSVKGQTATIFIDGKNRGTYTFNKPFANSPRLTLFGLGITGTVGSGNSSVAADFDNIAIWSQAIETEADARALVTARPDEIISDSPTIPAEGFTHRIWNFNDQEGWNYMHQNPSGPGSEGNNPEPKSVIEKGILKITVRPNLYDRRKAYVDCNATTGRYKWRMYLPEPGSGDTCSRASFAAFIYHSDTCEFDFEIARGRQADRNSYGAQNDEMLAMMTSQANPFSSVKTRIKQGWHTVEMDLSNKGGNYYVQWFIDGKVVHTLQTSLAANKPFQIYCSLENLIGTGDYFPKNQTTALFDQVEYYYHP